MNPYLILLIVFVGGPAFLVIATYLVHRAMKKRELERLEAIVKKGEDSGERTMGRIRVWRKTAFSLLETTPLIHEVLVLTQDKVSVERVAEEKPLMSGGASIDWSDQGFAIPISVIKKVELDKIGWKGKGVKLRIITIEKEYEWYGNGLILPDGWRKKAKLEEYENILRPVFGEKLSVKK